jgi:DNA-binding GntR family transcriptional regulator
VSDLADVDAGLAVGGDAGHAGQQQPPLARSPALRSPKAARIYSALLAAILDHRLPPGARLPEDELGSLYGVSRTIVRTALQALAHERVVTIEPNRGAQVAQPTAEEARHVFEARSVIEPRVAALAAGLAGPEAVAHLRRHISDENAALAAGDTGRAIALSGAFHLAIAEISQQPILAGFVRELISRSSLIVALYWHRPDTICERHAHAALADAIAAGEGQRAADLMVSHLVDLLSGLDLRPRRAKATRIYDLLAGGSHE